MCLRLSHSEQALQSRGTFSTCFPAPWCRTCVCNAVCACDPEGARITLHCLESLQGCCKQTAGWPSAPGHCKDCELLTALHVCCFWRDGRGWAQAGCGSCLPLQLIQHLQVHELHLCPCLMTHKALACAATGM